MMVNTKSSRFDDGTYQIQNKSVDFVDGKYQIKGQLSFDVYRYQN